MVLKLSLKRKVIQKIGVKNIILHKMLVKRWVNLEIEEIMYFKLLLKLEILLENYLWISNINHYLDIL